MARHPSERSIAKFASLGKIAALCLALSSHSGQALALGLMQAYQAALVHDPAWQAAVHEHAAGRQARAIGRAALLPMVSASVSASRNRADYTQETALGPDTTHPEYDSKASVLSLRQPIVSLDGMAQYRQGEAQANYSEAQFAGRRQDLLLRVLTAYLSILLADEQLALAAVQRDALAEQSRVNERLFGKGEGTRTDMLETQARLDLAEAQLIEAHDNLATARSTLAGMVGGDIGELDRLPDEIREPDRASHGFEHWLALALEHNPEIAAQRFMAEAAAQETRKAQAGHYPSLDLVASYSRNKGESVTTFDQSSTVRSVGLQLTIPIYTGGRTGASALQAAAQHQRMQAELAAAIARTKIALRTQYDLTHSGIRRIDALAKAVSSARLLVKATEQSVRGGLRVNLDVLGAQQQLFTAQRDLAEARCAFLLAYFRLRGTAGTLTPDDLQRVGAHFTARP